MLTHGWNTWDVYHLNGLVHLPSGLRLCFHLLNPATGEIQQSFNWRSHLRRLGPHAADGSYLQIELEWAGTRLTWEAAAQGERLVCRLSPAEPAALQALLVLDGAWGTPVTVSAAADELAASAGGRAWQLRRLPGGAVSPAALAETPALSVPLDQPLIFSLAPAGQSPAAYPAAFLETRRQAEEAAALGSSGWLADAAAGMTRALHWNTIWEPLKGRVCTPVSREWCTAPNWGGYVLFDWDTFFAALMAGTADPALAAANVRAILQEVTARGFVPNYGSALQASDDRSQPPVGAYCVLKLFRAGRLASGALPAEAEDDSPLGRAFVAEVFPALLRWHRWWLPHRDGNRDGLLEWGSDPLPGKLGWEVDTLRAAMYESGLDNSPMYDEAVFNPAAHTMELADVGLNALYALDAWSLSELARELDLLPEAAALAAEYQQMGERINRELWNEAAGIYQNRHWDGRFSAHLSPTLFYPLLAGIVPPARAQRMLHEHLLNPEEFWGEFVIPSIARNDPGYHQSEVVRDGISQPMGEYWRGRIWGPMNFLVCEGLRRCGFDDAAHQFARRSLNLFLPEWREEAHVHENYHDLTGDGDDVTNSNPLYHWGALLAYLGLQELADREAWGGWRFGCLADQPAGVQRLRVAEGLLDVASGPQGLQVHLNGQRLLAATTPVLLRDYHRTANTLSLRASGARAGCELRLSGLPPAQAVALSAAGGAPAVSRRADASGELSLLLEGPDEVALRISW